MGRLIIVVDYCIPMNNSKTMNSEVAFPWFCIACEGFNRGEPAHRGAWGRICWSCWILGAEADSEDEGKEKGKGE